MIHLAFLVIMLIAAPIHGLVAQRPAIRSGDLVRVEMLLRSQRPLVGTLLSVHRSTLLLSVDNKDRTISTDSINRVEVHRSGAARTSNILKNAAAGLLVGTAGGAIAGPLVLSKDCYSSTVDVRGFRGCIRDLSDGKARLEAAAYFGVAGTLIGVLFGAFQKTDSRWEEIRLDGIRLSVAPELDGGLAVRMSVAFET